MAGKIPQSQKNRTRTSEAAVKAAVEGKSRGIRLSRVF